jgi:hypothetical protein
MRQLSLARAHSIKRRSRGFFLELTHDALPALHSVRTHDRFCIRVFSAWDGPSRLCFHFLDGPDCGGWGGREIAESLTGVEHDPKCGFVAFQRSRLWEGDLQNPELPIGWVLTLLTFVWSIFALLFGFRACGSSWHFSLSFFP